MIMRDHAAAGGGSNCDAPLTRLETNRVNLYGIFKTSVIEVRISFLWGW